MKNRNFGDWAIALTVVACSVVLFLALALALSGTMLGKPGRALRVNFHDVMGITPGAQVKYGGAMAGKVAGIRMLTLQERAATGDPLNTVEVTLALNDNVPPLPPAPFPPQPDTSSNGRFSTASFRMPYPKGHTKNPFGLVQSPGELGFIHTGLEGKSKGTPAKVGIPWRTLRLQPSRYTDTKEVPDWALMDLFTVPSVVPAVATTLFAPYGTAIAGRVNLNATAAEPFGLQHRAALAAVLLNARKSSVVETAKLNATEAATLADAIFNRTLADKKVVGAKTLLEGKQYGYTAGYDSPGEVAEIKGIADGGEESEELVRSISNLLTTRSNVFSVYSIGQAIKQTPSGKLIITAEQRQHSMVERYLNTNNKVNFRSVYFRNINP